MKKLATILCIFAFTLTLGTAALAAENRKPALDQAPKNIQGLKMRERIPGQEKRPEIPEELKEIFEQARESREENAELMKENMELRQEFRELLKELREDDGITEELKEELKTYQEQIRAIHEEMMESRGSIKTLIDENIEAIKAGDEDVIQEMLDEISEIQETRSEQLEEINDLLKDMIKLVK